MTEDDLKTAVLDLCKTLHLLVAHFRPARTEKGWRTPVQADGKGYPDLTIVGPHGVMWRELKAAGKYPDTCQRVWGNALQDAGCDWGVWRPEDLRNKTIEWQLKAFAKEKQ